ncbi:MAG: hypothetical protein R6V85_19335 [Polyangia bacterium]
MATENRLERQLNGLAEELSGRICGIVRGMTLAELTELAVEEEVRAPSPVEKRKPAPARKKKRARSARKPAASEPARAAEPQTAEPSEPKAATEPEPEAEPEPRPEPFKPMPVRDSAAVYRRAEQERLENAVLSFVKNNPGTDAEPLSLRLGLPKGRAQSTLDDLVLRGVLKMTSRQHGRCFELTGD